IVLADQHAVALALWHATRSAGVALVTGQPGGLAAPVHVLIRLPGVFATGSEAEGAETTGLQSDVTGENNQVGPGDLLTILLLDRPQQTAGLVQTDVVRPGVERSEALLTAASSATAIAGAVGAGRVPGHADHQTGVAAEIGRPPVLAVGHELEQVGLECAVIELLELLGVVELFAQRIRPGRMLAQQVQTQLIRPPIPVGRAATGTVIEWTFTLVRHASLLLHIGSVAASTTNDGTSLDPLRLGNQFITRNGSIANFFRKTEPPQSAWQRNSAAVRKRKSRQQKTGH